MEFITRLNNSILLALYSLFPSVSIEKIHNNRTENVPFPCPAGYTIMFPENLHRHLNSPDCPVASGMPLSAFIPQVFPLTAPLLLGYLKKHGYSACRAKVTAGGLAVTAER
jgi:hypothetical protein